MENEDLPPDLQSPEAELLEVKLANLRDERRALQEWFDHPGTVAMFVQVAEEQESFLQLLTNNPVRDLETFFAHFEAIGHLRGIRWAKNEFIEKMQLLNGKIQQLEKQLNQ